jgi:hypothetical protein
VAQAIAIIHRRGPSPWLDDLLESIETSYPLLITNHEGWMIDGVRETFEKTEFDEIFFLNESMIVKDNSIWDLVFREYEGRSVCVGDKYLMCLGKYLRDKVKQTNVPVVYNKHDDVTLGEFGWNRQYMQQAPDFVTVDLLTDTFEQFEEKHGRTNMILENGYFKKWKHTYDLSMIHD